jgi:putative oxidoreductase
MKPLDLLRLKFIPANVDAGLLLLRVWLGASMLLLHGWPKIGKFSQMSSAFPDPFGVGPKASLILAIFAEVVCAALLVVGFLTRFAALNLVVTMAVAFLIAHKGALTGPGSGELAYIYLAGFITLLVTGPGNYSLDQNKNSGGGRSRS